MSLDRLKRGYATIRYEGALIFLWRTLIFCFSPVVRFGLVTLYKKDLTQSVFPVSARAEIDIIQATSADIDQLAEWVARRRSGSNHDLQPVGDIFRQRFQRGESCFIAKAGAEIVHYNWIAFGSHKGGLIDPLEGLPQTAPTRFVVLKEDEAYCHDGYTVEGWRGKGIHAAVNSQMQSFLQKKGYRRAYTWASTDNKSSWKALEQLGWQISGTMFYFGLRRRNTAWIWCLSGTLYPFVETHMPAHES